MSGLLKNAIKLPNINWNFVMLGGHLQTVKKGWTYPKESHLIYELIYVLQGREKIQWSDYCTTLESGEFVIISPSMDHVVSAVEDLTYFCFHFDINDPSIEERLIAQKHLIFKNSNPQIKAIVKHIRQMITLIKKDEHYSLADKMKLLNYLANFIISVYKTVASQTSQIKSLYSLQYAKLMKTNINSMFKQAIDTNINSYNSSANPQSTNVISQVCKKLGLSQGYASRIYHECFGSSPQDYLNQLKIQNAKRLLLKPNLSIGQIAFTLGYKEASNFSRQFKKMTGLTPKKYRLSKSTSTMEKQLFEDNFKGLYEVSKLHPNNAWQLY